MRTHGYGFIVLPEERKDGNSPLEEGDDGTIFADVSTYPHPCFPGKIIATLYYKSNFAKWNPTTEAELINRFPKSFAKNDAGDEYTKLRANY